MKPKRRAVPGVRSRRTPTVRRVKPAIVPVPPVVPTPSLPGARRPVAAGVASPAPAGTALDALGGRPVAMDVDLGRGLVLGTPVLVAAGVFGYGVEMTDLVDLPRLGGIVTRGTTLKPRAGHPPPRSAEIAAGVLWGVGLQNPGLEVVLDRYAPAWSRWPIPVILNLCAESTSDLAEASRRLDGVAGVAGVELNLSCQHGTRGMAWGLDPSIAGSAVGAVRRATELPLIAKLTPAAADVRAVARACEDAGADAISAVNTLPGLALAADRRGPALGAGYGGIAGPALRPIALRVVFEVAQVVDIPVIGIGGVATAADALDLLAAGAVAVGVGTAALADPMFPVRLSDDLADACRELGIDAVAGLVGTALPAHPSPPSARGAEFAR
jgi:dihydroorotate dehydrogenase (NAD+) catalytic subunit